jgi:16S rRNA (adenine1518-N6/adenine1519-N6)-dimethyltransferase
MEDYKRLEEEYIKKMTRKVGGARRQSGQNFLICKNVVETIVTTLRDEPITELGAGLGAVTEALLKHGCRVRAIEQDKDLIQILRSDWDELGEKLEIIENDLRQVEWQWNEPYQVVGNIPYNLSGLIMRKIMQLEPAPEQVILVVQKEVAERLTAQPPQMNLLGLATQLWGKAEYIKTIPADCFWPKPKVESAIVKLTPRQSAKIPLKTREAVLALARPFFQQKRKQLGGVLSRTYNLNQQEAEKYLAKAGITSKQRPQELTLLQWMKLKESFDI